MTAPAAPHRTGRDDGRSRDVGASRGAGPTARLDCPACGEAGDADPFTVREMMFGTRETFRYLRCRVCGSLAIAEVPADLARHYPDTYYARAPRRSEQTERAEPAERSERPEPPGPSNDDEARRLAERGGLSSPDDPVLDVGCGAAPARLAALRRLGYRAVLGIEPYVEADLVWEGVPVRKGYLADVPRSGPPGPFQLVMFHHSLEHIADPLAALRAARARLRPDGRVVVRTPIVGGYFWRWYRTDWVEIDAPRHLVVFSLAGLERLAARAGFDVVGTAWESGAWELVASEQYRRDVAMHEPGSWFQDPAAGGFDDERIAAFTRLARHLNETGDAGRAAVWLRPRATQPRTTKRRSQAAATEPRDRARRPSR